MDRKEFANRLYDLIANNSEPPHIKLSADDFAYQYCNISESGKNDYIYIEFDSEKVGKGCYKLKIEPCEKEF